MDIRNFIHDPQRQQFRLSVNESTALVDYVLRDGKLFLTHSEVPESLRGQGVGKVLVEETFSYLRAHGLKAHAVCSYIRVLAQRDPQWADVVSA